MNTPVCFRALILPLFFVLNLSADSVTACAPPSVIFECLALNHDLPTVKFPKYRSPADLVASPDKSIIYICEQTAKRIAVFSLASKSVTGYIHLPNEVTGCAVSSDGSTLYATCSSDWWPAGYVCVVNTVTCRVTSRIAVGFGARSPVLSPDNATLFVCNRFDNDISKVNLVSQTEITRIPALREPYCSALTPDGTKLLIGNLLPDELSTDTIGIAADITIIDANAATVIKNVALPCGSHSLMHITISPDGAYAFVPHVLSNFTVIASDVRNGWLVTNNLAVIDVNEQTILADICLDDSLLGAANPWGVTCSHDGSRIAVTHAGSNELSCIRLLPLLDSITAIKTNGTSFHRNFFLNRNIRERMQIAPQGPRTCVFIDSTIYTVGFFDDTLAAMQSYNYTAGELQTGESYSIGTPRKSSAIRKGECQMYDGTICYQHWQSCVTCHPFARTDGLNHVLGGGAINTPKNTISLIYSWWNPPTHWTGHRHAETAIRAAIRLILFQSLSDELADPFYEYLEQFKPVASPLLEKGRLTMKAQHGKNIFLNTDKVDCLTCHPLPMLTDNRFHSIQLPDPFDLNPTWVCPSMREIWRTAPYGHLGGLTIRETCEHPGHSTNFSDLNEEEKNDLLEYLLSL